MQTFPLRQFVVKLSSRCDLRCDYCYVYEMADQRWRQRPVRMSPEVLAHTVRRISDHVTGHGLAAVDVALHGGEPLLAGREVLRGVVERLRASVPAGVTVRTCVQTNGMMLDTDWLDLLLRWGIRVGVSLDGDRTAQDRHRMDAHGGSVFEEVRRAVLRLGEDPYRAVFSGLLCTIDLRNDPLRTYRSLLGYRPPSLDFLLPHGNWLTPPPGRDRGGPRTPYADWLIPVFDAWYREGTPSTTSVRLFESIVAEALGGTSTVEGVGTGPLASIVVETDGGIEHSDLLASAYQGAAETGLNVVDHSFDEVLALPMVSVQQQGKAGLCRECRHCDLVDLCGGGIYAHRYGENGFAHPSVYCPDLYRLHDHIRRQVLGDLSRWSRTVETAPGREDALSPAFREYLASLSGQDVFCHPRPPSMVGTRPATHPEHPAGRPVPFPSLPLRPASPCRPLPSEGAPRSQ
jgi:uncharacterized protein